MKGYGFCHSVMVAKVGLALAFERQDFWNTALVQSFSNGSFDKYDEAHKFDGPESSKMIPAREGLR